jgi:Glycosyl hydrolases family 8/Dolichyl-phosphate-mannose-protein mannosyltransferase
MNYLQLLKTKIVNFGLLKILFLLLTICLVIYLRTYNIFTYPYYENDEGTYLSQAWAVTELNKLAPYTYWYDHAPLGWMILGFMSKIFGGYNLFGNAMNTGRFFILILNFITTIYLFLITKKITNNYYMALASVLFFSILPLASYHQRRIFLDNIMVTVFSGSLFYVLGSSLRLKTIIGSGLLFGMSMMTKESALVFLPGIAFLLYTGLGQKQKFIGSTLWSMMVGSIVSLYILLAIFKTELFPSSNKVSLIGTLGFHLGRKKNLPFWQKGSDFMDVFDGWMLYDSNSVYILLTVLGLSIVYLIFNFKNRYVLGISLLNLTYILFLIRGGIVLQLYIIPLVFLLSILFGMMLSSVVNYLKTQNFGFRVANLVVLIALIPLVTFSSNATYNLFNKDEVSAYQSAVDWFRANVNSDSKIIIDCGIFPQMHFPEKGQKVFKNADWYWKASYDPEIRTEKLKDNPENVDYLLSTFQFQDDVIAGGQPFTREVFVESKKIQTYVNGKFESTILKMVKNKPQIIKDSWSSYRRKYVKSGAVLGDDKTNRIVSTNQANAMTFAVLGDDKYGFDQVWNWTRSNMQRQEDKLFYSEIKNGVVTNSQSRSDAEVDIALALYMASTKWNNSAYLEQAKEIINELWNSRVLVLNGKRTLIPFITQVEKSYELINPSMFSPAHFRIFEIINPEQKWSDLSYETYELISSILKKYHFIPNYVLFDYKTNEWRDAEEVMGKSSSEGGYEAQKLYWRLNLDKTLFGNTQGQGLFKQQLEFYQEQYKQYGIIASSYNQNKQAVENYESTASDAGIYNMMDLANTKDKDLFWRDKFIERVDLEKLIFDPNNDINNQYWGIVTMANRKNLFKDLINLKK